MAVEIKIDLDSKKAHGKIEALETRLKAFKDKVKIDFDVDDDLKDSIQKITDDLKEINVDVDYSDLSKAAALKAMLEGDIDSDLNIDTDKALRDIQDGLDPPGASGIDHSEQARKFREKHSTDARLGNFMSRMERMIGQPRGPDGGFKANDYGRDILKRYRSPGDVFGTGSYDPQRLGAMSQRVARSRSGVSVPDFDFDMDSRDLPSVSLFDGDGGGFKSGRFMQGVKKKLKSLIPSMNTFYTVFAAIIPIAVALGTQLLGVAAAMGSVAVAGAAMVGLGLLGHGEDMASSWRKAKEQLSTLKDEMFATFQPTMQTFAPIQGQVFDMLPDELNQIATAMESLTVYSDTLMASIRGISAWVANGIRGMAKYEGIISQLALRFGELAGSNINQFFRFLVVEAYESQDMIVEMGRVAKTLIRAFYDLSKFITALVIGLSPLATILGWIAGLLDNKLVVAVFAFVAGLGATIYVTTSLISAMTVLVGIFQAGLISSIISSVKVFAGYIFQTIAATVSTYGLAAAIANVVAFATLGIGALFGMAAAAKAVDSMSPEVGVSGGFSGMGGVGSGAGGGIPTGGSGYGAGGGSTQTVINEGNTYNMEVNGDVDNQSKQGLRDIVKSENGINSTRGYPQPGE